MAAFFQRCPVHSEIVKRLRDLRSRAADRVGSILADVFGAAGIESVRRLRALHTAEQAFFPHQTKQRRLAAILRLHLLEFCHLFRKKLHGPPSQIRCQRLVITLRRARIELADENRLWIAVGELAEHRLRRLFHKTFHLLRIARPCVLHRQIPPQVLRRVRAQNRLRRRRLDQVILTAQPLGRLATQPIDDLF